MSAALSGSLTRSLLVLAAVSVATAAGISYIHRGQRLEREARPARARRPQCGRRLAAADVPSLLALRSRPPQTLHQGVVRDRARLAQKRAELQRREA